MKRMKPFQFDGCACVLTGAASGIGAALATDLAGRGARLLLIDRDEPGLDKIAALARDAGSPEVMSEVVDLGTRDDRAPLAGRAIDRFGRVDLLINNAGVALGGRLTEVSMADIDWLLDINLRGTIAMTMAFLPHLIANPGAHVVNLSSLFGIVAPPAQAAYATSKFGVRGFSESLRHEMEPRGIGVTVVHPGGVRTNIAKNARVGALAPASDVASGKAAFDRLLRLPPEKAAAQILAAVAKRRPRLVITPEAKALDTLARLAPARYWRILRALDRSHRS